MSVATLANRAHFSIVHQSRVANLARLFAQAIPPQSTRVLDVGAGDGLLAKQVMELRPELRFTGVDIMLRPRSFIEIRVFDGQHLPAMNDEYDVVMFSDVLHHTNNQAQLLREAARVARDVVIVKDHLAENPLDHAVLRVMDYAGNRHSGVRLPYEYFSRQRWHQTAQEAGLSVSAWNDRPHIYSAPLSWAIGRDLHVLASFTPVASPTDA